MKFKIINIISVLFLFTGAYSDVSFDYNNEQIMTINNEGSISGVEVVENSDPATIDSSLVYDNSGQPVAWVSKNKTFNITGEVKENDSVPQSSIYWENENTGGRSILDSDGSLRETGQEQRTLVKSTVYVGNTSVYSKTGNNDYELDYYNLNIAGSLEGRLDVNAKKKFYYLKDHLGSIREVITNDADGNVEVAAATKYNSYGHQSKAQNVQTTDETKESFTGKEFDTDGIDVALNTSGIDLYYFGARYFDPVTGLWNAPDPKDEFFSGYAYTTSPTMIIDPDGQDGGLSAAIAIIGVVVSIYTSTSAVEGSYNPTDWNWNTNTAWGAYSGFIVGTASSMIGGEIGGLFSSQLLGAAVSGAVSGATGTALGIMANDGALNNFEDTELEDFITEVFKSAGIGSVKSMAMMPLMNKIGELDERLHAYRKDPDLVAYKNAFKHNRDLGYDPNKRIFRRFRRILYSESVNPQPQSILPLALNAKGAQNQWGDGSHFERANYNPSITKNWSMIDWIIYSKQAGECYGYPYAHIVANAGITKSFGPCTAWSLSMGKEFIDLVKGYGLGNIESNLYSAFQPIDFQLNALGRDIRFNPNRTVLEWAEPFKYMPDGEPGPFYKVMTK